jgi:hypothetical protein
VRNYADHGARFQYLDLYISISGGVVETSAEDQKDEGAAKRPIAKIMDFMNQLSDIITSSMPDAPFGHYTGYIECVQNFIY